MKPQKTFSLDFTTHLSAATCRERLKREVQRPDPAWHILDLHPNGAFMVERRAGIAAILRAARQQPVGIRFRGTLTELDDSGRRTRVQGRLSRGARVRLVLEFWRFPVIMGLVIALVPYHAFGTVIAALIVAILPLVALSWWRWWRVRREALKLIAAVRARLGKN